MIKKRINKLRSKFINYGIDGYVVPKNDEFFSEYSNKDRLKFISNFTGSAGYAVILKNRNYLFVDGRYTIQSKIESGKDFKILDYFKIINTSVFKNLNLENKFNFFVTANHFETQAYCSMMPESNNAEIVITSKMIDLLNPLITTYLKKESIQLLLQKDRIIFGDDKLDITKDILKIFDDKYKKIKFE